MIARVFPRRTKATPPDGFTGPPGLFVEGIEEVHVSVTFSWDVPAAERLAAQWEHIAPVRMGGPAMGDRGGEFVPGRYLAPGYVITSRGCPNRCWFCDVWKREGPVRELEIQDGWNVLDDNLLACSNEHVKSVFAMLEHHRGRVEFTGGLEAARLQPWHVDALWELKPRQLFFAYDTADDLEPLQDAGAMLLRKGWTRRAHRLRAFVLIGYPGDVIESAYQRLQETLRAGFLPMAMLWRDRLGKPASEWQTFQRRWARPAMMAKQYHEAG